MASVREWAQRGRQLSVRQWGAEGSVEQGSEVPLQLTGADGGALWGLAGVAPQSCAGVSPLGKP